MACQPYCGNVPFPWPAPCQPQPCQPYPCCVGPTGPTGPALVQSGPTSWVQAVLSAADNTLAIPAVQTQLSSPWVVQGGNADNAFQAVTGTYIVPQAGVYEISYNATYYNATGTAIQANVTADLRVNTIPKIKTFVGGAFAANGNTALGANLQGVLTLQKGDVVQIWQYATAAGLVTATSVFPLSSPAVLNIKSLF